MINPGMRPVEGAIAGQAEVNMRAFVAAVREQADLERQIRPVAPIGESVRDESLDEAGRYGWILPVGDERVPILMPGIDLPSVRAMSAEAPCLRVRDSWAWWTGAVQITIPATRAYILGP